jgi:hypothetical protein
MADGSWETHAVATELAMKARDEAYNEIHRMKYGT